MDNTKLIKRLIANGQVQPGLLYKYGCRCADCVREHQRSATTRDPILRAGINPVSKVLQ